MKISNQLSKHFILVGLIILKSTPESFSQVITRVLSPEDKIENYIPWYNPDEETPVVNAPFVDVEAVLLEDQQEGRLIPRVSINQETNISSDEWHVIQRGNFSIWNIALASENAKSMSVRFENTYLPEDAMMFIYNRESRFIVGPISSDNFINGAFRSDYVSGSIIEVSIFVPGYIEPNITISSYDYGIVGSTSFTGTFGVSDDCNINVACGEGSGWECQINSVCRILTDEGGPCSASLVNNDCCDLTPFLLTADHCVDGDLGSYLFIFNWQTPECENGDSAPTQWITYLGAQVSSNWEDTDFSLLELIQDIRPEDGISFSGWDRRDIIPDEVTLIHHPRGDVKKISFDENPAIAPNDVQYGGINPFFIPADHSYFSIFNEVGTADFGIFESGSSGCGWFNQEQRIVGTMIGGNLPLMRNYGELAEDSIYHGNGNGTPDSRLRDWLGASTNPNTMDCMEHPFIQGPEVLCTDPQTFTLMNNMPCAKTVTWRVEPANLFASPSSGNGVTASLWGNNTSSGPATLIYTLSAEGCNDAEVGYDLFVGRPCTFELHSFPTEICVGEQGETFLNLFEDCLGNYSSIEWDFYGAISGYGYDNKGRYAGITTGYGYVCVTVTNDCGSKEVCDRILVKDCGGGFGFRNSSSKSGAAKFKADVFPNPANEFIEIACSGYVPGTRIAASLISTDGKVVRELEEYSQNFKVDMADLPSGLYVLQLNTDGVIYHEKIVKL